MIRAGNAGPGVVVADNVWLLPLKDLDGDARAVKLGEIAGLEVSAEHRMFVGDPLRMALTGLAEDGRYPYVIDSDGTAVGVLTLQAGAATLAGWPDDHTAWLLRGFAIDRHRQGRGLGRIAAAKAVVAAAKLTAAHGRREAGVVLSVNEANPAGLAAYRHAGFVDHGQYLGGTSGPQRIMYSRFTS
ncbi:GNAT family N-acetyltransferase [Pseudarthrobacter sulfonivorans]|uniref:GNAT family N-acetyltransferase n=1 Tax=Pseudarthrobacter sulfonivorans TaxID=121292 RepID=UPI0021055F32|nr:GNAT family N-acetyltransferase [Pseudarthrobacter sulfonivorans]